MSWRQERYLRQLTEQFDRRDWDDALAGAIGLAGTGSMLTLRLPHRRASLRIRTTDAVGGAVDPGPRVREHLRRMYADAATALEREGRYDAAAFVHADLLGDVRVAVDLLARNGELVRAAEIAEGRKLPPEHVVRLWWLAGNRDRAVQVARVRGAFAAAIDRLATVDPAQARALRAEWVRTAQESGAVLAAVEAAWPDPSLRGQVLPDIAREAGGAGPSSAIFLAYLAAERPDSSVRMQALRLMDTPADEGRSARGEFIQTYAGLDGQDPVLDRELSTAAATTLVRDTAARPERQLVDSRQVLARLNRRADPLTVADLPPLAQQRPVSGHGVLDITAPREPGQLTVTDAVVLGGRSILLAHGDFGVRLVGVDGRQRARWDVPAHSFVVADDGRSVLLVVRTQGRHEMHRLDLTTRKVTYWTTLEATHVLPSYDGGVCLMVERGGLSFLDVLSERPRVMWRELGQTGEPVLVGRTPDLLSALVAVPGPRRSLELWVWELPGITLRMRRPLELPGDSRTGAVAGNEVRFLGEGGSFGQGLVAIRGWANPTAPDLVPNESSLTATGPVFALMSPTPDGGICVTLAGQDHPEVVLTYPERRPIGVRWHAGVVTVWDDAGRVVAVDTAEGRVVASMRSAG